MTDQELDRMMRRVLLDSLRSDELYEKEEEIEPFAPSRNHKRQMRDMLKDPIKWLRNKTKPVWKVAVQKVAVVLLIASLGLGSVMAVSPTVRAAVIQWVTEWYETHITFRYAGDSDWDNLLNYEILGLPEGYSEVEEDRIEDDGYIQKKYRNDSDPSSKSIYLAYMDMKQGAAMDFVIENGVTSPIDINGMPGYLYLADDWQNLRSTITWIDESNNLQFVVDATMSEEDILYIAESVCLAKMLN